MATFLPVALTIDVEVGDPEAAARALSVIGSEDIYSSRVVFHETVHYWQQLSQGFLLRRAEEDWQRLIDYERAGQVGRDDSVSREFYREEPTLGFSAHDLQECLARFWEVVALSPNRIMRDDWISDRSSFHPDYIKANRQSTFHKRRGALPPWRDDDFRTAMMMIGGDYAVPFLATGHRMPNAAIFVFPWLAHYALQTARPAKLFANFVSSVAPALASRARDIVSGYSDEPSEAFGYTMFNMAVPALVACLPIANNEGENINTALATYASSDRATSPLIAWTFKHRVVPIVSLLKDSQTVLAFQRTFMDESSERRALTAVQVLEYAMATPGLIDSRTLLLLAGLAPPCVRFPGGNKSSMPQHHRRQARDAYQLRGATDPFDHLLPFVLDSNRDREDETMLRLGDEIAHRWQRFINAGRTGDPGSM